MQWKILAGVAAFHLSSLSLGLAAGERLYSDLGPSAWMVTTRSPEAQRYFNQGLAFLQGFNRGAAIRSFQQAAILDPGCAMTHWAIAYESGPYFNGSGMSPAANEQAWQELQLARGRAKDASPVERALIKALACRYANPPPADRRGLDQAYAEAMRQVWARYPRDPEVGVLRAEALLDLRPWDQWTPAGQPQPGTEEVIATLEAVLKLDSQQLMANHLYIHTLEASPFPERAAAAADRLRREAPPGLSHLLHMPSHIDLRLGHWQDAITANQKAIDSDARYRRLVGSLDADMPGYPAHNRQMLVFAAMMSGQGKLALDQTRALLAEAPPENWKEGAAGFDPMAAMPMEVMVRFGRWNDILAEPANDPEGMPFARAFHLAARAVASAALGKTVEARAEQALYLKALDLVPKDRPFGANSAGMICAIVTPVVEGEILVREGKLEPGLAQLRSAVAAEDALHYSEPPGWLMPVRQSLAANLLAAEHYPEAEQCCREDLRRHPENGWSLQGLARALAGQGKAEEAAAVMARFRTAWRSADVPIASSCFCQPGR